MIKKLSAPLFMAIVVALVQVPMVSDAYAAEPAKKEKKKKRKSQLVSPYIGKKVNKSFELYEKEDIKGALVLLQDITAKEKFDKAYVARFIAIMYATLGDADNAVKYLKEAVEPDILNTGDHAEAMKLLADLLLQQGKNKDALKYYFSWMEFTGKENGDTWTKVANAQYQLKQLPQVIESTDKAIATFKKPNKNPYILKLTAFYDMKKFKDALLVLETAVQVFPKEDMFWTQLGTFYLLNENYPKALSAMEMAYKLGFLVKENQIKTLASLYSQSDVPYKSAKLLEKHMKSGLVKNNRGNISSLASAWQMSLHIDRAANAYGELAKLTNDAKHYNQQGMLLKQDEQFSEAIVALKKALEVGVKSPGKVHMAIAESYFYLGKYKQAYAAVKKAAKDPKTKRVAKGWTGFIKDTARRKNVSI